MFELFKLYRKGIDWVNIALNNTNETILHRTQIKDPQKGGLKKNLATLYNIVGMLPL